MRKHGRYWMTFYSNDSGPAVAGPGRNEMEQQPTEYELALVFVQEIDWRLTQRVQHLWDCQGNLLMTLDQVLVAIEKGHWPVTNERLIAP